MTEGDLVYPDVLHTAPTLHPSHLPYSRFITAVVAAAVGAHVSISKKKAPGHPMIVFSTAEGGSSFFLGCSLRQRSSTSCLGFSVHTN